MKKTLEKKNLRVFFSCGESSGDLLGAELFSEMKKQNKNIKGFGLTGPEMRKEGILSLYKNEIFTLMGFTEVLGKIAFFKNLEQRLLKLLEESPPDVAILIDNQEFHQSLGEQLKLRNIRTVLYVAPQAWAWREKRAWKLRERFDLVLGVLPFEKDFFKKYEAPYYFVGSPVFQRVEPYFLKEVRNSSKKLISFFPGSRKQELNSMLPTMFEAMTLLKTKGFDCRLHLKEDFVGEDLKTLSLKLGFQFLEDQGLILYKKENRLLISREKSLLLMQRSDFCVLTSGTASLECTFLGTPSVTVYRTGWLNYAIAKAFVRTPYISLPNLILREEMVKEFIQSLDPVKITEFVENFLKDRNQRTFFWAKVLKLRAYFRGKPSKQASNKVFDLLSKLY